METQKLRKSVPSKIALTMPAGWVMAFTAIGLLLSACIAFLVRLQEEKEQHGFWADSYYEEQAKNDALRRHTESLRIDIDMLTSPTPPGGVSSEAATRAYIECLHNPVGLEFSPYLLTKPHEGYYVDFRVHNPGILLNRAGGRFLLGSPCDVDPNASLKIVAVTPLDYVLGLEGQSEDATYSCPAKAYHLVHLGDEVMKRAIAETCIAKAKAIEFQDCDR